MAAVLDIDVPTPALTYPVIVGAGVLDRVGAEIQQRIPDARRIALVSDTHVMPLHGARVRAVLEAAGLTVTPLTVPAGEASKTVERAVELVEHLVAAGLSRSDAVVALGGGVTGDLAGLVAAWFMRGIPFVQCPTSLLAQVDASVGGKVAVDLPAGKNLVGAFHFPRAVLIDPTVLATLPDLELGCGLAEMLKHGALFSRAHWDALLGDADALYARDQGVLTTLVAASVGLKAACVRQDPFERTGASAGRMLLNLGHTLGHAIESVSAFEIKHGQAVGLGLRAAARLSVRRGLAPEGFEAVVTSALERLRLPTALDPWLVGERGDAVARALSRDKKRAASTVTYIALSAIGEPHPLALTVDEIFALLRPTSGGC